MKVNNDGCHDPNHHCSKCHDSNEKVNEHENNGHACTEKSCDVQNPHGHVNPDHKHNSCFSCMKEHLRKIFPIQEKILESEKLNPTEKEIFITGSFLVSSIPIAKIASAVLQKFDLNPFANSLISGVTSITSMHFANRGKKNLDKFAMLLGSCAAVLGLQRIVEIPRPLIRSIMAIPIFLIERLVPDKITKHEHHQEHKEEAHIKQLTKKDLLSFAKVQSLILSVPSIADYINHKIKEKIPARDGFINSLFSNILLTVIQIGTLTAGFVGIGKALDKGIAKLFPDIAVDKNTTGSKTESTIAVCEHCGIPGCIDTVTESIAEASEASVISTLQAA